jgi:hypothetical protein
MAQCRQAAAVVVEGVAALELALESVLVSASEWAPGSARELARR